MPPKRRNSKRKKELLQTVSFFFITIFSIMGLLVYLWVYNEINITVSEVSSLDKISSSLENDTKMLANTIARLERIDRITGIARDQLGMVTAAPETVVVYVDYSKAGKLYD